MKMHQVESTNVEAHGYDANTKTLAVRFKNGDVWHYQGVPQAVVDGLAKAKSIGSYLHASVKSKFKGAKQ